MHINIRSILLLGALSLIMFASHGGVAAAGPEKDLSGIVTQLSGNQVIFKTTNAVVYSAETSNAVLTRRNGTAMLFSEFAVGDRVEVHGQTWQDNSMSATRIRNLTVYAHNGTFTGKITTLDPLRGTLTVQGNQYGTQTVHTSPQTVYMKNGSIVPVQSIAVGMSATIKGTWERTRTDVVAREVRATVRLLNIDITGQLMLKDGYNLTVVSNGVLYGIDASTAKVKSKNNKLMLVSELAMSAVRVQGKHIQESPHIVAATIKDLTTTK